MSAFDEPLFWGGVAFGSVLGFFLFGITVTILIGR